jgi:hypothetical protein
MNETKWDGEKIASPGLYTNIPMVAYHGALCVGPSVSSSTLRTTWAQSPAHAYQESYLNPDKEPDKDERPHFAFGRCAHKLLLEGREGFDQQFVVRPEVWTDWRTKDSKDWKAAQIAAGKTVITAGELQNIVGMAKSLATHPMVRQGILDGAVERSLVWRDEETGLWLKSRPDAIPLASGDFSDLKTTESVSDDAIERTLANYGYHQQGALVGEASAKVLQVEMASFTLIFVEKEPPHAVRIVTVPTEDLQRGAHQNRWAMREFAKALDRGIWPGPGGGATDAEFVGLPNWSRKKIDDRLERLVPLQEQEIYERTVGQ